MILRDYLYKKKLTSTDFAKKLGMNRSYFSRILCGRCRTTPTVALQIEILTEGSVSTDEVLFPEKYPS